MQPRVPVPFWTASRKGRSTAVTAEKLTNWFLEQASGNQKFPFHLLPTPGLTSLVAVGDGPVRGFRAGGANLWVVSGGKVYSVSSVLAVTEIGEIAGSGAVDMAWNGTQMLVTTSGQHAYSVNASGVVEIAETNLQGAAYQEGYGAAIKRGTEDWYISGLDDMSSWSALDFTNADMKPDQAVGIASIHGLIWVFGAKTVEKYSNTGNSTFPFERVIGDRMEVGCIAHKSIAILDNTAFWLGHDLRVYKAVGPQPVPISTPPIEKDIEGEDSPQTAEAFVYTQEGHTFYVLTFSGLTIVYDDTTGLWHHRKSQGISRWRVAGYEYAWNKHIVGDYSLGRLYYLDLDAYDENGTTIRREADSAPFSVSGDIATMWELFADMEAGTGLDGAGQGSSPLLMMQYSDDQANTWSNERTASIGKIGEYGIQARFFSCGQFRSRTVRLAISDPVKAVITGVYASVERMGF